MKGAVQAFAMVGLLVALCAGGLPKANADTLDPYYYNETGTNHYCPGAQSKIQQVIYREISNNRSLAAELLRLHFHDCFVEGCDGSALIYKADHTAERDGFPNLFSLAGFGAIDKAKAAVEEICPRIVSCADIVAQAARDAVVALSGPMVSWNVLYGRKDGNISLATEANTNLPPPTADIATLIRMFAAKNLTAQQMVALSGAHTIGTANCTIENPRLYPTVDPTLNPTFANYLKQECPNGVITNRIAMKDMTDDPLSNNFKFDNLYYSNVLEHKGAFKSDNALITNATTLSYVNMYAGPSNMMTFINAFKLAIIAMGNTGVRTTGYVRGNCSIAFS